MEYLLNLDTELFKSINSSDLNILEPFLILIRGTWIWIPLYIILTFLMMYHWQKKFWVPLLFTLLVVLVADTMSSTLIKKSVKRPRPCRTVEMVEKRVPCGSGYSFTSSHATNHMALGVFWIQLFSVWGRKRWWFLVWALAIGFAQIFVGVHYPLDVLSGFILGGIIGLIMFKLFESAFQKMYPNVNA